MIEAEQIWPMRVRPLRRTEYQSLAESGAFGEEKLELIRGTLITRSPAGTADAAAITLLNEQLILSLRKRASVRPQLPLAAGEDSMPEPDLAVIDRSLAPGKGHPSEALLVIEVANSSLNLDRNIKAPLYAEAKVPEYWLVDLTRNRVEVYRTPVEGRYTQVEVVGVEGTLVVSAFPDIQLKTSDFLLPEGG